MEPLLAVLGSVLALFGLLGLFAGAHEWLVGAHLLGGAALLAYSAARRFRRVREVVGGQSGRTGANVVVQTLLLCGIAGMLAFLSVRNPVNWDWTESRVHTLSPATLDLLERIPETGIEILAFYARGSERDARSVLDLYTDRSGLVRTRFHDPNERPALAQRYEIASSQGVILVCGGACETAAGTVRVTEPAENELTKAIRSVIADKRKLYALAGHGEAGLSDDQAMGLAVAKTWLEDENYEVAELILGDGPGVPDDADAVLVAGPNRSLLPRELASLDRYLRGGGSLAVLADPLSTSGLEGPLREWGVELGDDLIVEEQQTLFAGPQLAVQPIVSSYGSHPATEKLARQVTLFHLARSVSVAEDADGESAELALTGPSSWAESDTESFVRESLVGRDPETDRLGPLALAVARTLPAGESGAGGRLVVVGDSDFARNRYVAQGSNADLFLNIVSWLVGQEEFATIERKLPRASSAQIGSEAFGLFRFLSLFVLPELVLLAAALAWWRRRA
ncbi:MAG: GldG family protein [Proteobacteria bacterium]|nr:GldG family protein [Pseudomonadota bacterium]